MQATMPIAQANMDVIAGSGSVEGQLGIEQAFADHKELVFRAAYPVTGTSSAAEDVLQTVFLRLLRLEQTPEIRHLRASLHRPAVNAALDLLRARKDSLNLPLEDQPEMAGLDSASSRQGKREERGGLRHAVVQLNR